MCIRDSHRAVQQYHRETKGDSGWQDPTTEFVKALNNKINQRTQLFDNATRRSLKPINAEAPQFVGLPKIHKTNVPIRPLINFTTAPSYSVSKKLAVKIKNSIKINNNHSIKNNTDFVNKMKNIKIRPNYKIASFDIVDLYTNCLLYTSRCV